MRERDISREELSRGELACDETSCEEPVCSEHAETVRAEARPAQAESAHSDFAMARGGAGLKQLAERTQQLLELLARPAASSPYSGLSPAKLTERIKFPLDESTPCSATTLVDRLAVIAQHSIDIAHPRAAAHLHCPTLTDAVAVELLVAALNPSLDSFDQAPIATMVELQVIEHLRSVVDYPATAGGTFTPGATQSNLLALLLARESFYRQRWQRSAWNDGVGEESRQLRILCSEASHFSVEKSAAQLGLGCRSVVRVACDEQFRMSPSALVEALREMARQGELPLAIVATAGTTDAGAIDPLDEIASIARDAGVWLHVDAAYGGALLFSARHRERLRGLAASDSVSLDFHKLMWQPIGCGALLVRDVAKFDLMRMHADYLNPEEHELQGVPDLVTRSLLTTRRFDALKLWTSLQSLGSKRLGEMIDHTLELASNAARYIASQPTLELITPPQIGCVLFRYAPSSASGLVDSQQLDAINSAVRRELFEAGEAVVGETRVRGRVCLKFTCLNPLATDDDYRQLIDSVEIRAQRLQSLASAPTA